VTFACVVALSTAAPIAVVEVGETKKNSPSFAHLPNLSRDNGPSPTTAPAGLPFIATSAVGPPPGCPWRRDGYVFTQRTGSLSVG